jgi:acetolactate synthase-1/2/3 large subunit
VIHGAVEPSLARIVELVEDGLDTDHARGQRSEELSDLNERRRSEIHAKAASLATESRIQPRLAAAAVGRALPADVIIVDETLTPRRGLLELIDHVGPGGYFAGAIGGLGTGLGTALGVKTCHPDRLVVCTIGDGSLGYEPAFAALLASRDLDLPLLIVVMNNSGYLSQKATLPRFFPDGSAVEHGEYPGLHLEGHIDFESLARAFGGYGESVSDPALLDGAMERSLKAAQDGQTAILDIRLVPTRLLTDRGD